MKTLLKTFFIFIVITSASANTGNKWNFYTGMFDFSDDGKRSTLFGIQHQNENLIKDSFIGTISPVTGLMFTADNAGYVYTGIQAQYNFGKLTTPSWIPGKG